MWKFKEHALARFAAHFKSVLFYRTLFFADQLKKRTVFHAEFKPAGPCFVRIAVADKQKRAAGNGSHDGKKLRLAGIGNGYRAGFAREYQIEVV